MSYIAEESKLGILPLQNHEYRREFEDNLDLRHVTYGVRLKQRDESKELLHHDPVDGTFGDIIQHHFWPTAGEELRKVGAWTPSAWPAVMIRGTPPADPRKRIGTKIGSSRRAGGKLNIAKLLNGGQARRINKNNKLQGAKGKGLRQKRGGVKVDPGVIVVGVGPAMGNSGNFNIFGNISIDGKKAMGGGANWNPFGQIRIGGSSVFDHKRNDIPFGQIQFRKQPTRPQGAQRRKSVQPSKPAAGVVKQGKP